MKFILSCAKRCPNDLAAVARIARIYPSDLLGWYLAGQVYDCPDLPCAELAWGIAELRFERAAKNQERIERAADGGKKMKTTVRSDGSEEIQEEDVLPAQWAIQRLEDTESAWNHSPNDNIGAALLAALKAANDDCEPNAQLPPIPDVGLLSEFEEKS